MIRDFYDELCDADVGTVELDGRILTRRNNSLLHACKKGAANVEFLCQSKKIRDGPYGLSSALDIMTTREFVESERLCKNCKRIIQEETEWNRLVVAVSDDEPIDAAVERFTEKRNETLKSKAD